MDDKEEKPFLDYKISRGLFWMISSFGRGVEDEG